MEAAETTATCNDAARVATSASDAMRELLVALGMSGGVGGRCEAWDTAACVEK